MGSVYSRERYPNERIGVDVICSSLAIFTGVNLLVNVALRHAVNKSSWFSHCKPAKKKRTVLYILSSMNATLGAVYGLHHYVTGSGHIQPKEVLVDRAFWCVVIVSGYIMQDLLMLLPDWKDNKQDIFHHLSVLFLGFVGPYTMPVIYPILPAFALQELSTPFLNLMWFAKEYECIGDSVPQFRIKQIFAILFGVFRVVGFPLEFWTHRDTIMTKTPAMAGGIGVFCGLQFFWFYLIVKKAVKATKQQKHMEVRRPE